MRSDDRDGEDLRLWERVKRSVAPLGARAPARHGATARRDGFAGLSFPVLEDERSHPGGNGAGPPKARGQAKGRKARVGEAPTHAARPTAPKHTVPKHTAPKHAAPTRGGARLGARADADASLDG